MWAALVQFEFMRNAMIAGMVIGLIAPVLGVFIVVKRLSMIADALSHITLSGIAFSLLLGKVTGIGFNPLYAGMTFSVVGALSIEQLRKSYRQFQEVAIPIIMSAGIGSGVLFISMANGFNVDLFYYLFGSIIAVRRTDVLAILAIGILVGLIVLLFYKELFSLSFDEEHARISGLPGKMIHFIFMLLIALVIASAMRIVGILLVSSLMILPVAASLRVAKSFKQTFLYAILFGEIAVLVGLYFSFLLDWAPGGTIVILSFLLLCVVMLGQKLKSATKRNMKQGV